MLSFAMTSGLASDFDKFKIIITLRRDKFKIIITLRRAQKFWDTGPYKKFDFLFKPRYAQAASDFDKFKIIITLRRAQKFWDTGPYKNSIFCLTQICPSFFAISAKI